jgi:hypothetical protein
VGRASFDRLFHRRQPGTEVDAALTVAVLSADLRIQRRVDELRRLRRDDRRCQCLQNELGGPDVPAAVPAYVEDQPAARQPFDEPDELGDERVGIVHVEREDPQVSVIDLIDGHRESAEHRRQARLDLAPARAGLVGAGVEFAGRDLLREQELAGSVRLVLVEIQADGGARLVDASVLLQCRWEIRRHQPRLAELTRRAVLREPDDHPVLVRISVDAQRADRQ